MVACGGSSVSVTERDASTDAGIPFVDAGEHDAGISATDAGVIDASIPDAGGTADSGCPRLPAPENATRFIVVSHPYNSMSAADNRYEVFSLSPDGGIAATGNTFHMGRAFGVGIHFTPDGRLGFVAQDDGTVGVFSLDAQGSPTVEHAALSGAFNAADVVVGPSGNSAFVIDYGTEDNGGGLYPLSIACNGTVTAQPRLVNATSGSSLTFLSTGDGLVASKTALGAPTSQLQKINFAPATPQVLGHSMVFADTNVLVPMLATTRDEKYVLMPDNGLAHGSRLGIAKLTGNTVSAFTVFNVPNPGWVAMSPFDNAALVVSSDGADNFRRLRYDTANSTTPFMLDAPMTYTFGKPELPLGGALVERGALKGRVIVAEIHALRQLQFTPQGSITDVSRLSLGSGMETLIGAIGVTP